MLHSSIYVLVATLFVMFDFFIAFCNVVEILITGFFVFIILTIFNNIFVIEFLLNILTIFYYVDVIYPWLEFWLFSTLLLSMNSCLALYLSSTMLLSHLVLIFFIYLVTVFVIIIFIIFWIVLFSDHVEFFAICLCLLLVCFFFILKSHFTTLPSATFVNLVFILLKVSLFHIKLSKYFF